jgi:hypothetical protein
VRLFYWADAGLENIIPGTDAREKYLQAGHQTPGFARHRQLAG